MKTPTPAAAKVHMKRMGHSYRSAARALRELGHTWNYQWLCEVLNGQKTSAPVLRGIFTLPKRNGGKR